MKFIGIDPGKSGGLAMIEDGNAWAWKMPATDRGVLNLLEEIRVGGINRCLLEFVHAMPGQGVTSMFNFGQAYGQIKALLTAVRIDYELVTPQKWQGEFNLILPGLNKTRKKNKHKRKALKLYPEPLGPKDNYTHATADALLIAEYCRRVYE